MIDRVNQLVVVAVAVGQLLQQQQRRQPPQLFCDLFWAWELVRQLELVHVVVLEQTKSFLSCLAYSEADLNHIPMHREFEYRQENLCSMAWVLIVIAVDLWDFGLLNLNLILRMLDCWQLSQPK